MVGHGRDLTGSVLHLRVSLKQDVAGRLIVVERIGPHFLLRSQAVHVAPEEKHAGPPVVPSFLGGEHIASLPEVYIDGEFGLLFVGMVEEAVGLDEYRIGEHIDVVHKGKHLVLRTVRA